MPGKEIELLTKSSGEAEQPFRYSVGRWGSKFLAELRDHKKLLGVRCPKCQKVYWKGSHYEKMVKEIESFAQD